ncbi:MAG TPA: cation diffusion facilitator family transporter [Methanomassiliicoccales archaeon]|nr:cation diffusion facilitator family transporter [Methanomassiliicoccales archaeon]
MEHEHHHRGSSSRMLTYALVVTAAFALVELAGGVLSGSLALLSDAGHMFTDVLALGLSLGAALVAGRQATARHTFGFLRAEILVALVNGIALVGISLLVINEALGRLSHPTPVDADLMLIVAVAGMGANILGMALLHRGSKDNLNVRGAFLHMMGDLLSSFGVIAAALLIRFFGWQEADALIGLAIAAIIMVGAYRLISQSVSILLEAVPKHIQLEEVEEAMSSVEGVIMVHDLHVWTLSSGVYALSGHVVVDDRQVSACSPVLRQLERMLEERFHIGHATLQIETEVCPGNGCAINCRDGERRD